MFEIDFRPKRFGWRCLYRCFRVQCLGFTVGFRIIYGSLSTCEIRVYRRFRVIYGSRISACVIRAGRLFAGQINPSLNSGNLFYTA